MKGWKGGVGEAGYVFPSALNPMLPSSSHRVSVERVVVNFLIAQIHESLSNTDDLKISSKVSSPLL